MSLSAATRATASSLALIGVWLAPSVAVAAPTTPATRASVRTETFLAQPGVDLGSPALSFTGRYLAYYATPRGTDQPVSSLLRADLRSGRSVLVNRSLTGGPAPGNNSRPPLISGDGTKVAFSSDALRLVPLDSNGRFDAFVRDLPARRTMLASVAYDGGAADGDTGMVSLARGGRFAVFTSSATDVVPGSTTPNLDVFRRDLATGSTVQVTVRPNGSPSRGPGAASTDISRDGNVVAFVSYNTDLAPADGADGEADLFVRFMAAGRTRWLSADLPAGANPSGVVISPDARWVSTRWEDGSLHLTRVRTGATTAVAGDGYALQGAFSARLGRFVYLADGMPRVRDLASGLSRPVSVPAGGLVTSVSISGNGRFAAYDWIPDDGGPSVVVRVRL